MRYCPLFIILGIPLYLSAQEFHQIDLEKAGWTGRFRQTNLSQSEWTEKKVVVEKTVNGREIKVEKKVKVETPSLVKKTLPPEPKKPKTSADLPKTKESTPTTNTAERKSAGTVLDFIKRNWK